MTNFFKGPEDFRKSLEARLQNYARSTYQDLQRVRRKLAFERLLARVFHIGSDNFALKGGYAMELRFSSARATRDIDLTFFGKIDPSYLTQENLIFHELQQIAQVDLMDFFSFEISPSLLILENAPYGGARYNVSSFINKKLFVKFKLDVGMDIIASKVEEIPGTPLLDFCKIEAPKILTISIEQQLAEKIHAFSLPRKGKVNSRVKDLIDIILLINQREIDLLLLKKILGKIFRSRKTHAIPNALSPPSNRLEATI